MNRVKNTHVPVTDESTGRGLAPEPKRVGRDQTALKVGSPPTPPKSYELSKTHRTQQRSAFERTILLLQGGGALGAYQGGVYQALSEADIHPDWVAGISIGSINAAIIAGNPPNQRVEKLREFWDRVTSRSFNVMGGKLDSLLARGDAARSVLNQISAVTAIVEGASGFFKPRMLSPWLQPPGTVEATSYYDTTQLKATLEALIDFDRINADHLKPRLSLGAVNVRSGNLIYFDSPSQNINAEHVMASGALPPGFPAVEIEGERFWDGGLVSNTPLQWIAMTQMPQDSLVFQVDLWSARGEFPRNLAEVATRQKEIQYSSRTRAFTDYLKHVTKLRNMLSTLLEELPEEMKQREEVKFLNSVVKPHAANIVHLIYRPKGYEGDSKDYEFSRRSMEEHWQAGYYDAVRALRHPEIFERAMGRYDRLLTFDFSRGNEA
ncbi:MAG TPA: patatin-like phospholipase family protein [Alphaproteobacteria bacterium]|nr:patatin-like phospholipase family protein [Alphaproteobacteria bacterium]